jgi:hypothetical protein
MADQREAIGDITETLRSAFEGQLVEVWTALPAIVQSFDDKECTCSAQPSIQGLVRSSDGSSKWVNLPVLIHVPVVFPRGGPFSITFPVKKDDECLIVFSSRCIDQWWAQGGIQIQPELRLHDLHDGFAFVGPFSRPKVVPNISTTTLQIRNQDGSAYIELTQDGAVNIKAPAGIKLQGTLTSDSEGTFNGHTVGQHVHIDPQGGQSGPPTG